MPRPDLQMHLLSCWRIGHVTVRRGRGVEYEGRALVLQGRYMGTMRALPTRHRARVKKIRAEKGIRAAIREARVPSG